MVIEQVFLKVVWFPIVKQSPLPFSISQLSIMIIHSDCVFASLAYAKFGGGGKQWITCMESRHNLDVSYCTSN